MAVFPDILADESGLRVTKTQFRNIRQGKAGGVQINIPHPKVQRTWAIAWSILSPAERDQITGFLDVNLGFFDLFNTISVKITGKAVGTGNGATTTFDLPAKEVSGATLKVSGTAAAGTLQAGTGADGRDRFVFNVAPANGAAITLDATLARDLVKVYLAEPWSYGVVEADIYDTETVMVEAI